MIWLFIYIYIFLISTKSKEQKGHPLLSFGASGIKKPFFEVALQTRESALFFSMILNPRR
uniref:Uncharacterized protein n=1 Tax=Vitis vinifera TaxID=29760 RepID=F6HSI2_VITVI